MPTSPLSESDGPDLLLRELSRSTPEALVRALWPAAREVQIHGWPDTQLVARQRRLDRVLEATIDGVRQWIHVEWEQRWRRATRARVFEYQTLLALAQLGTHAPLPIQSVVVLLGGREAPWPARRSYRISPRGARFSGARFGVEAVYQRTVDELLARPGELWPVFAPLAVDASRETLPRAVRALEKRARKESDWRDLATAMVTLADADGRKRGLGEAVLSWLPLELRMHNRFIEQGRVEGKAEGKAEGEARGLLTVLAVRKLRVSPAQRARITAERDLAVLDRWLARAVTVRRTSELFVADSS